MKKIVLSLVMLCTIILIANYVSFGQSRPDWKTDIKDLIAKHKCVIGISISDNSCRDTLQINGNVAFPMQSVFKFHIALAVLSEIDKGKFKLEQKVEIAKEQLMKDTWSPIRDKYPDGTSLSIAELLNYTVSQSDNNGCDILLKLIGGTTVVNDYLKSAGFKNTFVKVTEAEMHASWDAQFNNTTTPDEATRLLLDFYTGKIKISEKNYQFLMQALKETTTGPRRIKSLLPEGTVVAHKTGTGGTHETTGITSAVNDIGIVFLPNGNYFVISVLVAESKEAFEVNEKIIAEISKIAWDHFAGATK